MAINLLPWRESKSKKILKEDFLRWIGIVGIIGFFLEIGLFGTESLTSYFSKKASLAHESLLKTTESAAEAKSLQQKLNALKKESAKIKQRRKQIDDIQILIKNNPSDIQLEQIDLSSKNWIISGSAKNIAALENYQKSLAPMRSDIKQWSPEKNMARFELEILP